jgi:hypothetical protein
MDMNRINEQLLIERYLQGTLSDEEEKAFEEALISSPELMEQLETAERLREGLKDLHAVDGLESQPERRFSPAALFHSPRYALAATVLLAVSLVTTGKLYMQMSDPAMPMQAADTHIMELHTVRGTNSDDSINTFELKNPGNWQVLMVDPGYELYSHYRATLTRKTEDQSPEVILELDNMQPDYQDQLALGLPSNLLSLGDYEVHIEGWRNEWPTNHDYEPVNSVTFRVQ